MSDKVNKQNYASLLSELEKKEKEIQKLREQLKKSEERYEQLVALMAFHDETKEDEEFKLAADDSEERRCRVCGCTWYNACEGGCYWVEEDLCSMCAEKMEE